jgi:cytochrome P450
LTEGEQWRRQRTAIQNAFTLDRIQRYGDAMARYADELVTGWNDGEEVALNREFSQLTLRVLAHSLFDLDLGKDASVVAEFAETLNDRGNLDGLSTFLPVWVPTRDPHTSEIYSDFSGSSSRTASERFQTGPTEHDSITTSD